MPTIIVGVVFLFKLKDSLFGTLDYPNIGFGEKSVNYKEKLINGRRNYFRSVYRKYQRVP